MPNWYMPSNLERNVMKVAITSTGRTLESQVDPRFGRAAYFIIIDTETMIFSVIENENVVASGGAGISSAKAVIDEGAEVVLTGNCGPNAFRVFGQAGIQVIVGVSGTIRDAVEQFNAGKISSANGPNVQSHFGVDSRQQPNQMRPPG